jgi:hypothetical protein
MYIGYIALRQNYLVQHIRSLDYRSEKKFLSSFLSLTVVWRQSLKMFQTAFLSLCENIAVYCILRMWYTKVQRKYLQRVVSQFTHRKREILCFRQFHTLNISCFSPNFWEICFFLYFSYSRMKSKLKTFYATLFVYILRQRRLYSGSNTIS